MKKTISFYDFERAFKDFDRVDNFSYDGLRALFEYLTQYEQDTGSEVELDVIALCCEFTEINDDEEEYKEYIGEDAPLEEDIIQILPNSVLVLDNF